MNPWDYQCSLLILKKTLVDINIFNVIMSNFVNKQFPEEADKMCSETLEPVYEVMCFYFKG